MDSQQMSIISPSRVRDSSERSFNAVYELFSDKNASRHHPPKFRLTRHTNPHDKPYYLLEQSGIKKNPQNLSFGIKSADDACNHSTTTQYDTLFNPMEDAYRQPSFVYYCEHGASLESQEQIQLTKKIQPLSAGSDGDVSVNTDSVDDKLIESKCKRCGPLQVVINQPVLSLMLIFVPLGMCSYILKWCDTATFCLNFLAIVPQAWLIGKATEDLASHLGQVLGGILNAWFGNIVEMLLCVAAIRAGELVVVKATLVGSILSNLLLVAGCSFLFGGFYHKVQEFSAIGASTNASLMTLSCLCLGLPTLYGTINPSSVISELNMSRSVSFLLIFMYIQYVVFQLVTHSFLFDEEEEKEETDLSVLWAGILLGVCTMCCACNSEALIYSIEGTVNSWKVSKSFIGIILLPIIGNAAEHYTSVIVAMRNKMDLSLACAVGSSCQMALFVTPLTVLAGWACGVPMSLDLHTFEMAVLLLAVLIVTSILQDGYSNWLEGSMLVSAYFVIGFALYLCILLMTDELVPFGGELPSLENVEELKLDTDAMEWCLDISNPVGAERKERITIDPDKTFEIEGSRGTANFVMKWPGSHSGKFIPVIGFDCRGLEPINCHTPSIGFSLNSTGGKIFEDVDLSENEWCEYDEKKDLSLGVYEVEWKFEVHK